MSPSERHANRRPFNVLAWLIWLVATGLCLALAWLTREPELLSSVVIVIAALAAVGAGAYCMSLGLGLMRTRDFARFKWRIEIVPKHVGIAANLFGVWFLGLGILVFWFGGFFFFRLPFKPWMLSLYLWLFSFQFLVLAFKKRGT